MKQTTAYKLDVPSEFAFDWLLHGNFLLTGLKLKSFQFDELEEGGRFIAYEEINDHHFVPIKGQFLKLKKHSRFEIEVFFPGGVQTIDYILHGEDRTTKVEVTWSNKYHNPFLALFKKMSRKKQDALFSFLLETEKGNLQEAFHLNSLNTKISGLKVDRAEMEEKWGIHSTHNPYLRWVRPEV